MNTTENKILIQKSGYLQLPNQQTGFVEQCESSADPCGGWGVAFEIFNQPL